LPGCNEERALLHPRAHAGRPSGPRRRRDRPAGRRHARRQRLAVLYRQLHLRGTAWKGELVSSPHTRNPGPITVFEDRESGIGFSGTFEGDHAEARGTALLGKASLTFKVTLRWLAEL
jgi:hypothetical protein